MSNANRRPKSKQPAWLVVLVFIISLALYLFFGIDLSGQNASEPAEPAATQAAATRPAESLPTAASPPLQQGGEAGAAQASPQPARTRRPTASPPLQQGGGADAPFDFYLLSLSWSPDYCESQNDTQSQQCKIGRRLGFVLHGLWPQYERGYPSNCSDEKLPGSLKQQFAGLYPADNLYTHEWEKHGTCSGLPPEGYLALSKQLKEGLVIPAEYKAPEQPFRTTTDDLREAFSAANPGLESDGLGVYCSGSGRYLKELRVCYTPEGAFTTCSAEVLRDSARSCGRADFLVRNVR